MSENASGSSQRVDEENEFPLLSYCSAIKVIIEREFNKDYILFKTSITLVRSVVQMYEQEVDRLLEDCARLNNDIANRHKRSRSERSNRTNETDES